MCGFCRGMSNVHVVIINHIIIIIVSINITIVSYRCAWVSSGTKETLHWDKTVRSTDGGRRKENQGVPLSTSRAGHLTHLSLSCRLTLLLCSDACLCLYFCYKPRTLLPLIYDSSASGKISERRSYEAWTCEKYLPWKGIAQRIAEMNSWLVFIKVYF